MPAVAVMVWDRKDFWSPDERSVAVPVRSHLIHAAPSVIKPASSSLDAFVPQHPTFDWPANCLLFPESRKQRLCRSHLIFRPSGSPGMGRRTVPLSVV